MTRMFSLAGAPLAAAVALLVAPSAHAYGEAGADGPTWDERAVHLFTDRLRVDPDATDGAFSGYPPVRPLVFHQGLHEAARFYADDMAENGCFPEDHSSCDGTSFGKRLVQFYSGGAFAENIAWQSPDAQTVVFDGWLYSPPHRDNMLDDLWTELGTGQAVGTTGTYWVQDFGAGDIADEPIATSGTHWPLAPSSGSSPSFYLAVYDPEGDPSSVQVDVDGTCWNLSQDRGTPSMGTYEASIPLEGAGCVRYAFVVRRHDGTTVHYPSEGYFSLPLGGADCPVWEDISYGGDCGGSGADGGGLGGEGGGCAGPSSDGPDGSSDRNVGYSRCSLQAEGGPGAAMALWVAALLGLRRRRI